MYAAIHAAGVCHGEVAWRHVRRDGAGTLRLIDFNQATLRGGQWDEEWSALCSRERREVERMMDETANLAREHGPY